MTVVGLTGGICTGKSTVAEMFAARGAAVVDADEVAHRLQRPGEPTYRAIVAAFGGEILRPDGTIDRDRLGARVFADEAARRRLEAIMHPAIMASCEEGVRAAREAGADLCLVDAALLVEVGAQGRFDAVILVRAPEEVQVRRLMAARGLDRDQALARVRAQLSTAEKARYADFLIENGGPLEETERQVAAVMEALLGPRSQKRLDKASGHL